MKFTGEHKHRSVCCSCFIEANHVTQLDPAVLTALSMSCCFCRVFSCHLLKFCKLHPSLVVDQSPELLDFAGTTANVYNKEELYTHVVRDLGISGFNTSYIISVHVYIRHILYLSFLKYCPDIIFIAKSNTVMFCFSGVGARRIPFCFL